MIAIPRIASHLALLATFTACSLSPNLPKQSPALADMEEPLDLRIEPNDEQQRLALPVGTFSGLYLSDARDTLAAKLEEPDSVKIERVIENSPAHLAGLQAGDLVLEVEVDGEGAKTIGRPSQWRQLELNAKPGTKVVLFIDRAGREAETEITLVKRLRAPDRELAERFREEQQLGIVVRTATEFEARTADLGPGAGAVIVGMSQRSPWRAAGLRFKDLIIAIDNQPLTHPQELLAAARDEARESLQVTFVRGGETKTVEAAKTNREHEMTDISLPLLFSYEVDRGHFEWSMLVGLINYQSTAAAWRFRLLWVIGFGGGDADQLLEQGS
ncbi:MAG: C-terminal processing protease CtpA/Prc [Hyphomicrobiaceae bacterium]|jgi:C-terminal processing protease CtpA/Prc